MRPPRPLPQGSREILEELLQNARTKAEFQTVQAVWLRASLGLSANKIATAIGWHPSSVRRVQSLFMREGKASLQRVGRGGPRRRRLGRRRERALLDRIEDQLKDADDPRTVLSEAYSAELGQDVSDAVLDKVLAEVFEEQVKES